VEIIKSGLQSSLLVRHPETKELFANFDPQILTLIREAECIARLGLEVPKSAVEMRAKQTMLKENYNAMLVRSRSDDDAYIIVGRLVHSDLTITSRSLCQLS